LEKENLEEDIKEIEKTIIATATITEIIENNFLVPGTKKVPGA